MTTGVELEKKVSKVSILKALGPGIIAALALYASGDISLSTVGGARWGYSGLWLMLLACATLVAFFTVTSKYHLATGESLNYALARPAGGQWIKYYMIIGQMSAVLLYNSYIIKGMGIAWNFVFPQLSIPVWAFIWLVIGFVTMAMGSYERIENIFKVFAAMLSVTVLYLFFAVKPSLSGVFLSLVPRGLPGGSNADTWSLALSVMGATMTTCIIFGYSYLMFEKGWNHIGYKKEMVRDAFTAGGLTFILNALLWFVAVETLHTKGIQVKDVYEMARVIGDNLGTFGFVVFFMGLFAGIFSSWYGMPYTAALISADALKPIKERDHDVKKDWDYKVFLYIALFVPSVWLFTNVGFLELVLFTTKALNFLFVIPLGLVIMLANFKRFAPNEEAFRQYRATWWENLLLITTFVIVVYFCGQIIFDWLF